MTSPKPPPDDAKLTPVAATLTDPERRAFPMVDYCMHALAVTSAARAELRWAGEVPSVGDDQVLLVLGPATRQCAFVGGASGPRVVRVERRGADVVAHVGFPEPFALVWSAALVPRPQPPGKLVLVVHGSIMRPPGEPGFFMGRLANGARRGKAGRTPDRRPETDCCSFAGSRTAVRPRFPDAS